jgi:hypothetical protein
MNRTISLPKEYDKRILEERKTTGLSISEIIRRAIDAYFIARARDSEFKGV